MNLKYIAPLAIIAGLGYVAYKFIKGEWTLPSLSDLLPGGLKETLKESGVPGVTGDIIYNIVYDGLRESATVPGGESYEQARGEIADILPAGMTPTPAQIVPRAVALDVAEDIIGGGMVKGALLAPVTIGAGLGAITQQQRFYERLPEEARKAAIEQEYTRRSKFMFEHPVESLIGAPAQVIHAVTRPAEVYAPTPVEVVLDVVTLGLFDIGGRPSKPSIPTPTYTPSPVETYDFTKMVSDPRLAHQLGRMAGR
jgi:hypothetical protein